MLAYRISVLSKYDFTDTFIHYHKMFICMYACMYVYMYVCMYVLCMIVCMYVCILFMYVCMIVCMYGCMCHWRIPFAYLPSPIGQ